jgi:hypothetical protein
MKTILKAAVLSICLGFLFIIDVPPEFPLRVELVPKAHAILGVRRRAYRRGVIIGSSMAAESAATQSQPAAAPAPAPTPVPAPAPAVNGKPLPLGTVVASLPAGCTSTPVDGVNYYYCSGNFYRAEFQGNQLVYVTAKPE